MSNYDPVQSCHQKYPKDCSDSGNTIQNISCNNDKNDNKQKGFGCHDKVEFKYDEIDPTGNIPSSTPTPVLQVDFSTINPGDRVWLSGIVSLENDNDSVVPIRITITRSSPLGSTPVTIYSMRFDIDKSTGNAEVVEPFSHVDVPSTQLFDVRYQVLITVAVADTLFIGNVGPHTLTAIRFIR